MSEHMYQASNDPLYYLPRRPLIEIRKGHDIYSGKCDRLYMVASGRVKISRVAADGKAAVTHIVPPEGLFGAEALVSDGAEDRAVALDQVQLMAWGRAEIEQQIELEPKLALALMEWLVAASCGMRDRMAVMTSCKIPERVLSSVIQLARSLGKPQQGGSVRMPAMKHLDLAQYVGTSRELVNSHLNRFRRLGMVSYTRKHMDVYCEDMKTRLAVEANRQTGSAAS